MSEYLSTIYYKNEKKSSLFIDYSIFQNINCTYISQIKYNCHCLAELNSKILYLFNEPTIEKK